MEFHSTKLELQNLMFNFLKKKTKKKGLEQAKKLGLISETEFLKLKSDRASEELKKHLAKGSKRKK